MEWDRVIIGVLGALGGAATAIGAAYGGYRALRHRITMQVAKQQGESDASAVAQYAALAERLEKQNARWEEQSREQQKAIDRGAEREMLCQIRLSRYWGWMCQASDHINQQGTALRESGHGLHLPPLPLLKPPPEFDDLAGFEARSSAQSTEAIAAGNPIPPPIQKPPGT